MRSCIRYIILQYIELFARTLLVEIFAGTNFREFREFCVVRESLYPRNLFNRPSANCVPKTDEKLHENKEIMVKNLSFAKIYTREIFKNLSFA